MVVQLPVNMSCNIVQMHLIISVGFQHMQVIIINNSGE